MIERGTVGGTCVNIGCVPSKTLIRAGEINHLSKDNPFIGLQTSAGEVDLASLITQKDKLVSELRNQKYMDLIDEYNFDIDSKYYLLNPLVIRRCSTNAFKRNCETTKDRFNNSKQLWINEYDAIVYNFDTNVLQITYN